MGRYMADEDYMTGADMDDGMDVMYMTHDDMAKITTITDHVMDTLITDANFRKGVANAWRGVKSAAGRAGDKAGKGFDKAEDRTKGAGNFVRNRANAVAKAMKGKDQETQAKRHHKEDQASHHELKDLHEQQTHIAKAIAAHPKSTKHHHHIDV
jgi:hypothetical protein